MEYLYKIERILESMEKVRRKSGNMRNFSETPLSLIPAYATASSDYSLDNLSDLTQRK